MNDFVPAPFSLSCYVKLCVCTSGVDRQALCAKGGGGGQGGIMPPLVIFVFFFFFFFFCLSVPAVSHVSTDVDNTPYRHYDNFCETKNLKVGKWYCVVSPPPPLSNLFFTAGVSSIPRGILAPLSIHTGVPPLQTGTQYLARWFCRWVVTKASILVNLCFHPFSNAISDTFYPKGHEQAMCHNYYVCKKVEIFIIIIQVYINIS